MNISCLLSFLIAVLTSIGSFAVANKIAIFEMTNGNSVPLAWPTQLNYTWTTLENSAKILEWNIVIETPWDLDSAEIQVVPEQVSYIKKAHKIKVRTRNLITKLRIDKVHNIAVKILPFSYLLTDKTCAKLNLEFLPKNMPAPFFIGLFCVNQPNGVQIHLSFPNEVELGKSTVFETFGKGENYRVFDITKINMAQTTIGEFEFSYEGQNYIYRLRPLISKLSGADEINKKLENITESHFLLELGKAQLSLKTGELDSKSSLPFFAFQLLPTKIWGNFIFGLGMQMTFDSPGEAKNNKDAGSVNSSDSTVDDNKLTYMKINFFTGYTIGLFANGLVFQPRVYYNMCTQKSALGYGFETNQLGVGLMSSIYIARKIFFSIEILNEAISSPVIKKHKFLNVSINYKSPQSSKGFGIGLQDQTYLVTDLSQNERKFSQTIAFLNLQF